MVISLIYFNIIINDLQNTLSPWVNSGLFVDNLIVWRGGSKENQDGLNVILNHALKELEYWYLENGYDCKSK